MQVDFLWNSTGGGVDDDDGSFSLLALLSALGRYGASAFEEGVPRAVLLRLGSIHHREGAARRGNLVLWRSPRRLLSLR